MTEEEAREILGDSIKPDGGLDCLGWYLAWTPKLKTACLDGDFTAKDLEAIAFWMQRPAEGRRKTIKFRPQRGSLEDSMKEVVEIEPTKLSLSKHLGTSKDKISCNHYYGGFDFRIGWDTHIICIDGHAVGFSDGPLYD